jgi:hypothetical protein
MGATHDARSDKGRAHNKPFNRKVERFVLELYAGKTPLEAMEIAGYKPSPANARRMANSPEVRARLSTFFAQERNLIEIEVMRARRERDCLAYSNISNYFEPVIENGKPTGRVRVKDFTQLPREIAAAIQSIKPTKLGWEIKLHDKDSALRAIEKRLEAALEGQVPVALPPPERLGKKEAAALAAQNPDPSTSLGELMARRQQQLHS